jgi:hypothetical protein
MQADRIDETSAHAITAVLVATPPWSGIAACLLAQIWLVIAVVGKAMRGILGRGRVRDAFSKPVIEVADPEAWMVAPSIAATVAFRGIPENSPAGTTVGASPGQRGFAPARGMTA